MFARARRLRFAVEYAVSPKGRQKSAKPALGKPASPRTRSFGDGEGGDDRIRVPHDKPCPRKHPADQNGLPDPSVAAEHGRRGLRPGQEIRNKLREMAYFPYAMRRGFLRLRRIAARIGRADRANDEAHGLAARHPCHSRVAPWARQDRQSSKSALKRSALIGSWNSTAMPPLKWRTTRASL